MQYRLTNKNGQDSLKKKAGKKNQIKELKQKVDIAFKDNKQSKIIHELIDAVVDIMDR